MTASILLGTFILLVALGVPIAFCTGISALVSIVVAGTPLSAIAQRMFAAADSFTLLAIPFFMLAGKLMEYGGISKRIIRFVESLVGYVAGGMAVVSTLACMFFGAICGSSTGTVAAIGSIMLPSMEKNKYDKGFSGAVISTAGSLGILIPPSIPMIIYAVSEGVSVSELFTAGIEIGIISGLALIVYIMIKSRKCGYKGIDKRSSGKEILQSFKDAILALLMPIIVLGGIYGGFFTPTEAAAVACLYGFIVGCFVYKQFKIKDIPGILLESAKNTAIVMFIIATSALFGWQMTILSIPQTIANSILSITSNGVIITCIILVFLVFVGTFMEGNAYIVILAPLLAPIVSALGMNLVQFGIVMVVSVCVGTITPPLGLNMFCVCSIYDVKIEQVIKNILPFVLIMTGVLFLAAFVPQATMLFLG
ncbi:C4-dicarboxylate TRAP transporter large permease protein DctM [bioreactor metagenome]|uniref:C4-dicarboxylate TRAP transporter large permease protein DctM n=1 Tax=bioreactor metagenome TaxID=1076179 RepID=A0A644WAG3_9ZZZZ